MNALRQAQIFCDGDKNLMLLGVKANGAIKGRLLAIFEVWREQADVRMLLPAGIASGIARRLGMFVLRAKVQIADTSSDWKVLGVLGAKGGAALRAAGIDVPAEAGQSRRLEGGERIVRLQAGGACPERFLLLVRAGREAHWRGVLAAFGLVSYAHNNWKYMLTLFIGR